MNLGTHYLWDISNVGKRNLSYIEDVRPIFTDLYGLTGLTLVGEEYKQFEPEGVTAILLLAESHMSIHTWPEHQFAAIDLFSCKAVAEGVLLSFLEEAFETKNIVLRKLERGVTIDKPHSRNLIKHQ